MSADKEWSTEEEASMLNDRQNNIKVTDESEKYLNNHCSSSGSSTKRIFAQCLVTGAVMLTSAACGMPIGYSAILLPQLKATNGSMHIDEEIGSWIASVHSAATPLGSFLSGIFMEKCGRKVALQVSMLPLLLGWIIIAAAQNHALLLIGRVIAGTAIGLAAAPGQVMISEISEPFIRGVFSSVPFASYAFGILLVYALGCVADWRTVAGLSMILPVIGITVFFFLPESPAWLVCRGRTEDSIKALTWLRGGDLLQATRETEQLASRIQNESTRQNHKSSKNSWRIFLKPQVLKPFIIINIFNVMQILSGTYIVVFYAVDIIAQIGDDVVDNFLAAVLTSGVRFIFTVVAGVLLAVIGRRPLALGSGLGTAATALTLGTLLYANTSVSIYILGTLILLYVATNSAGFMILPGLMLGELYPVNVRGFIGGITFMSFNLILFGTTKIFPILKHSIGIHGIFWSFGGCSLIASLFLYLVLPETKGRTLSQIEDYFLEKNIFWISRDKEWERKNLRENQAV